MPPAVCNFVIFDGELTKKLSMTWKNVKLFLPIMGLALVICTWLKKHCAKIEQNRAGTTCAIDLNPFEGDLAPNAPSRICWVGEATKNDMYVKPRAYGTYNYY